MSQFLDHLANDAMPALIEKLSAERAQMKSEDRISSKQEHGDEAK